VDFKWPNCLLNHVSIPLNMVPKILHQSCNSKWSKPVKLSSSFVDAQWNQLSVRERGEKERFMHGWREESHQEFHEHGMKYFIS